MLICVCIFLVGGSTAAANVVTRLIVLVHVDCRHIQKS